MFFYMFDLIFSFVWLFFLVLKVSLLFYHEFTKVSLLTWNLSLQKSLTSYLAQKTSLPLVHTKIASHKEETCT